METVSTARRLLVSNSIHFHFFGVFSMKTDIEIAQETKLIPINELAHSAGLLSFIGWKLILFFL